MSEFDSRRLSIQLKGSNTPQRNGFLRSALWVEAASIYNSNGDISDVMRILCSKLCPNSHLSLFFLSYILKLLQIGRILNI